jgi:hypothetical protein
MKASMRSRQEPRRVSNGVIIAAMLLCLCVLFDVQHEDHVLLPHRARVSNCLPAFIQCSLLI